MHPGPRKNARSYRTPNSDTEHPNTQHIFLASRTVLRFADLESAVETFKEADNAGLRHIAECDVCIAALRSQVQGPFPKLEP